MKVAIGILGLNDTTTTMTTTTTTQKEREKKATQHVQ